MNRDSSICIKNISKKYKIYPSRNARLREWLFPFLGNCHEDKWVLQNIDLNISKGSAVGIIGLNGAGKSTLLKIIAGTVLPTTGSINFSGTVSALLELGLGFHPDFSGRQNVYMSGQLLGYSTDEINRHMQEIEEFAEIGAAIDEPVRTYSSGMQVRLAFSVATMKRPDILIVDEALSVGDAYFQQKSFLRIKNFRTKGTTLLLVSHDKNAIQSICDRAILLDHGKIIRDGIPEDIMNCYNAMLSVHDDVELNENLYKSGRGICSGNHKAYVDCIKMYSIIDGIEKEEFEVGEEVALEIHIKITTDIEDLDIGMLIKDRLGQDIYGLNATFESKLLKNLKSGECIKYMYSFILNLGVGGYSITTALHGEKSHIYDNYEWKDLAFCFQIVNRHHNEFVGCSYLPTKLEVFKSTCDVGGKIKWKNLT